ncbi:ABC transporter permease [Thermococcus sp. 2319x1]|uniref:fluoroquinolone export ABC transporter permease subunit n=1 Tax=Thermococcus sp. 2319x1 TaxID=1674923 RepID=UPI001581B1BC|nr:ABC transporter permease [Thermococcus sp. 2319x1]
MMKNLLKTNLVIGVRSYVYPIYVLIGLAYGLMLMAFPEQYLPAMVPIFLLFEPGLVGFMFVGTEIFAEKKDGAIGALAVTPMDWKSYIIAKTLLLSVLSIIGAILIMAIGTRSLNGLPYVIIGVFLVSVVYTLLGIGISAKYHDLDDYFVPILAVMVVSLLPFAHYHGYLTHSVWKALYIVPSYPALYFFKAPFEEISRGTLALSGIALLLWSAIAYHLAKIRFYKYAVEGLR